MRFSAAPLKELPPGTRWLAVSFFAGWMAKLLFGYGFLAHFALVPDLFLGRFWLWQGFSYIFIHSGFWHFLFNTFMLWMLGRIVEPEMGTGKFLLYFFGCGAAAALLTAAVQPGSAIPVIGASGAIYALLGAFAFMHPGVTVYVYFLFPMSARMMAFLLGAVEFVMTIAHTNSSISSITHLGGLAAGLLWLWGERRWRQGPAAAEFFSPASLWPGASGADKPSPAAAEKAEVDRLLEKISQKGQASLSRSEIALLDGYSKRKGGRS